MNYMGIDVGTTGCKACTFSETGRLLYRAYRQYPYRHASPGQEELDPELVAELVKECVLENNRHMGDETAEGIGISVSGDECVILDGQMSSLAPVMMSRDSRGQEELERLLRSFSPQYLFERTGLPIHRKYGVFRLMWYKAHEPSLFREIRHVMTWEDFLQLRLGLGRPVCSFSSAARLMLVDLKEKRYLDEVLEAADLKKEWFSRLVDSGSFAGWIEEERARELGFAKPVYLAAGGFDQSCAATGAGLSKEGTAVVSTGTMETLSVSMAKPMLTPYFMENKYALNYHLYPGLYICTATNVGGSAVVNWYRDQIEEAAIRQSGYEAMIAQCGDRPSGLLILPHFAGSGPPYKDADSMGAAVGLQFQTGRAKLLQGILEGITFELRQNLEMIEQGCGVRIEEIRAVGGGSRSDYWLQLKADITGRPVVKMENEESGCAAGAMAAMAASGNGMDWSQVSAVFYRESKRFEPSKERKKSYDPYFQVYRSLYPVLKDSFHMLKKIQKGERADV